MSRSENSPVSSKVLPPLLARSIYISAGASVLVMEDDCMNQILFVSNSSALNVPAEDLLRRSAAFSKTHDIHLVRTAQNFLAQRKLDSR